jgi:hypothetical protein
MCLHGLTSDQQPLDVPTGYEGGTFSTFSERVTAEIKSVVIGSYRPEG